MQQNMRKRIARPEKIEDRVILNILARISLYVFLLFCIVAVIILGYIHLCPTEIKPLREFFKIYDMTDGVFSLLLLYIIVSIGATLIITPHMKRYKDIKAKRRLYDTKGESNEV
jgi:amino acid permease